MLRSNQGIHWRRHIPNDLPGFAQRKFSGKGRCLQTIGCTLRIETDSNRIDVHGTSHHTARWSNLARRQSDYRIGYAQHCRHRNRACRRFYFMSAAGAWREHDSRRRADLPDWRASGRFARSPRRVWLHADLHSCHRNAWIGEPAEIAAGINHIRQRENVLVWQ